MLLKSELFVRNDTKTLRKIRLLVLMHNFGIEKPDKIENTRIKFWTKSRQKSEIGIASKELPQADAKEDSIGWEVDLLDSFREEDASVELYESFCQVLFRSLRDGARSPKELEVMLGLTPRQLNRWLSQTVNEHRIEKTMRPVRYETTNPQDQLLEGKSLYDSFLDQLLNTVKEIPLTQAELEGVFDLTPKQAGIWLAQAIQEKQITKLDRPARYQKAGFQREIF